MATVTVNHLHKSYNGKPAVRDLSFSVAPGEMLGLIGPNGAGKKGRNQSVPVLYAGQLCAACEAFLTDVSKAGDRDTLHNI